MSFWAFLDRRFAGFPNWPSERQWVTVGLFVLTGSMLKMAEVNPKLWDVKLFEILIQAIILTGIVNMVLAFHFSANKSSETTRENTGKAFEAITAAAKAGGGNQPDVTLQPGETAQAAPSGDTAPEEEEK